MDSPEVIIHLLDGSQSCPVQTWKFKGQASLRIGRAEDNDIILRQPMVSRFHAGLKWDENGWILLNESRLGTLVGGQPVTEFELDDEDTFQLGPMGPVLSLQANLGADKNSSGTISLNALNCHAINDASKSQQVEEIAGSDYFKNLQQLAKKLKAPEPKAQ